MATGPMATGPARAAEILPREITSETDTRDQLRLEQAHRIRRGYDDLFIVDLDAHHFETESWNDLVDFIEDPILRQTALSYKRHPDSKLGPVLLHTNGGQLSQSAAGRIPHSSLSPGEAVDDLTVHRDVVPLRRSMDAMGIARMVIFPNALLQLGTHPDPNVEINLAFAYMRLLTERILPGDPRLKTMAFLPFCDAAACERMIDLYADNPDVIGFMITSVRKHPVHHNSNMRLYAKLQEIGKPLAFHAGIDTQNGTMLQLDRFVSMHAISFVLSNIIHMTNWVMHGMGERFPKLPVLWIEAGLAYLPFLMQRLDNEYLMRQSEAPLLKRLPSSYIRDMYHCCQPMERTNMKLLEATFEAIDGENKVLFASDWPHWDFDAPSVIMDLPFLSEQGKRNILGETARRLFRL